MGQLRANRGLTMMETVLGLFLLVSAFTFVAGLYNHSLGHLQKVERNAYAAQFSRSVFSELRAWAREPGNYLGSWPTTLTDPDYPGFEARLTVSDVELMSACTDFESTIPSPQQVLMTSSCRRVQAQILFEGSQVFTVTSLIKEPERTPSDTTPVVVSARGALPTPLDREATIEFEARLLDESGAEIPDVHFSWSVEPIDGNATIKEVARNGTVATFENVYILRRGSRIFTGGKCKVAASVQYFGETYRGTSEEIELSP